MPSHILFPYRSPSPRPRPDPKLTQHPETDPKQTQNGPETEPNGAEMDRNKAFRGGTGGGLSGCGGWGGCKGKRKSLTARSLLLRVGLCCCTVFWLGLFLLTVENRFGLFSRRDSIRPLPPSPSFWPGGIFQGRGGGAYISSTPPPRQEFYTPPPLLEGYFQGSGGGCMKFGPVFFFAYGGKSV